MNLETHLTLSAARTDSLELARSWAARCGLKWTEILLDAGDTPVQPMITFWGNGTLDSQQQRAGQVALELDSLACTLSRVKVEAELDEWIESRETSVTPRYLEFHLKLRLPPQDDLAGIRALVEPAGGKLSRNARRVLPDGLHERFVTLRDYHGDVASGRDRCQTLVETLRPAGYKVCEVESEVVLFDSNLTLDAGWL